MDKLIELLEQIRELASTAVDALKGAAGGHEQGGPPHGGGGPGGPPHEGGGPPPEGRPQPGQQ